VRLLADENIEKPVVEHLRAEGHDVLYVMEMGRGVTDDHVLALAKREKALLVTLDKDFGELVFRKKLSGAGAILLRLTGMMTAEKSVLVSRALRKHGMEMTGCFTVITPRSIRIRKP